MFMRSGYRAQTRSAGFACAFGTRSGTQHHDRAAHVLIGACDRAGRFDAKAGGTAWKSKPSWYIVGKKDHTVHPDLERAMAKRMGATTVELDSSHVPMLSQPERVLDVIRAAAKAVQKLAATA